MNHKLKKKDLKRQGKEWIGFDGPEWRRFSTEKGIKRGEGKLLRDPSVLLSILQERGKN